MLEKLRNLEKKIFSTPYRWLLKKVQVINTSKKIERSMEDLYESLYDEPYAGNPNWAGDD